jgi:hypothetical protein
MAGNILPVNITPMRMNMNSNKSILDVENVIQHARAIQDRKNFTNCLLNGVLISSHTATRDEVERKAYLIASICNYRGDIGQPINDVMSHFEVIDNDEGC